MQFVNNIYFDNIQDHILQELHSAQNSVRIAVAWFTDRILFGTLCDLATNGVSVEIVLNDDDINRNNLDFSLLEALGGLVIWAGDAGLPSFTMHHKFCIIDEIVVITGSYNWSKNAQTNHENILVVKGDAKLIEDCLKEFNRLKNQYGEPEPILSTEEEEESIAIGLEAIIARLRMLLLVLPLGDSQELELYLKIFKEKLPSKLPKEWETLDTICTCIAQREYARAVQEIECFLSKFNGISLHAPLLGALRLEIKLLEAEVAALESEKGDIQQLLYRFEAQLQQRLGDLLREIVWLEAMLAEKEARKDSRQAPKADAAKQRYEQLQTQLNTPFLPLLSEPDQQDLKELYRKAVRKCHPDLYNGMDETMKQQAEAILKQLNEAYKTNDLAQVRHLWNLLEQGLLPDVNTELTEEASLQARVLFLKKRKEELERAIQSLKAQQNYVLATTQDWDLYFDTVRPELEARLNQLRKSQ